MRWNKPESQDGLSLREIFGKNKPTDPVKAELWTYWRAVIASTAGIPFFLYLAYADSAASRGYETLRRAGYRKWCARFFVINSHINAFGVATVMFIAATALAHYRHKRRRRRMAERGVVSMIVCRPGAGSGRPSAATNEQVSPVAFLCVEVIAYLCMTWFILGPLTLYCQLPWGEFFRNTGGRLASYLVFSSFLLEWARRWWKKNFADPNGTKWSFGQFAVIVLAWVAVLSVPVLFWVVGHAFSAVAATHENPYLVQIRKYELSGRANYDPKIMCRIGEFYEKGEGVSRNYQKAMQWYKHADASGYYPAAMVDIGLLYQHGLGVPRNYRMALNWYRLGVSARSARAMFHLGMLYNKGHGVSRNHETAIMWWRRAARAGYLPAKQLLAKLHIAVY